MATSVSAQSVTAGDANSDGKIDVVDVTTTISFILGEKPVGFSFEAADVNGDGKVGIVDVTSIIDMVLNSAVTGETACPDGNHPHMIDLGLPSGTKWACCNVGATSPEEYGDYFAWGETKPKSVYNWDTYQYGSSWDNVVNIGSDIAGTGYDAATANWGAPWRMPSLTQIKELLSSSTSTWTTQGGVNGRKFTGPNGASVFLPAAGVRWNGGLYGAGSDGGYWSSTLDEGNESYAYDLLSGSALWGSGYRSFGRSVRPVR